MCFIVAEIANVINFFFVCALIFIEAANDQKNYLSH